MRLLMNSMTHTYIYIYIVYTSQHIKYESKPLDVAQSIYFGISWLPQEHTNKAKILLHLKRFICTFLTKAACCRNIEIVVGLANHGKWSKEVLGFHN